MYDSEDEATLDADSVIADDSELAEFEGISTVTVTVALDPDAKVTELSDFDNFGIAVSLSVLNKSFFVNTSDSLLKINELKIEGKKIIKGNDFINSIQGKEIILY